ncbi:MAG TPA: hypothetical protein VF875_04935 [Anaeromyxobacter sp.]
MLPGWAKRLVIPAIVLALALTTRLAGWGDVYGHGRPLLVGDWDPHYHVLRAQRWLHGEPGAPWRDPELNWPHGAAIPWPPLFDFTIAAIGRAAHGADVSREEIAGAAAPLPVVLGLALVLLVAALGSRLLGPGRGWVAAFLVAVVPLGMLESRLGRLDQHCAEVVWFTAIQLASALALAGTGRRIAASAALAVLVPLAFWTWMGSALHLMPPLAAAAAVWVLLPDPDGRHRAGIRALALGFLGAAALLGVTVATLGAPGALASGETIGVRGLHVALVAASGAFLALLDLAAALRRDAAPTPAQRAAEVLAAASAPLLLLLVFPSLRAGIAHGLTAAGAANPWYENIQEFQPFLNLWRAPLASELERALMATGLVPLAAAAAVAPLAREWREKPERRPALLLLAVLIALLVPLWLARRRFGVYAILPAAIAAEAGIRGLADRAARGWSALAAPARRPVLVGALAALAAAPVLPEYAAPEAIAGSAQLAALQWLAHEPFVPGREGVLAPWSFGHAVQFYGGRPSVTSPFGTDCGPGGMQDAAGFWFARNDAEAEAALSRRSCGYVLLTSVLQEALTLHGFAPPGTPLPFTFRSSLWEGRSWVHGAGSVGEIAPARLFYADGAARGDRALAAFRLVYEVSPQPFEDAWKIFQLVPGARVEVTGAAGKRVDVWTELEANSGRRTVWSDVAPVEGGRAVLRLPFATGRNGEVLAHEWTVSDGVHEAKFGLSEEDVLRGRWIDLDLATRRIARR